MNTLAQKPIFQIASTLLLAFFVQSSWAASFKNTPSGKYSLEETHGYITFSYTHMGFSNPILQFNDFEVDFNFNKEEIEKSTFVVTIQANSIDSGVAIFDEKLRDEKHFFETKDHPVITYRSKKISQYAKDRFEVEGDLVIKGKSRPVTIEITVNGAGVNQFTKSPTIGVSATGKLKRSDWGLNYGIPLVGDEVTLRIEAELRTDPPEEEEE